MKKYFVIGNPIEHSLSPALHNYWIKENNIEANYDKKKLEEFELEDLIFKVKKRKIDGLNVTVPFKNKVISFLDKLTFEAEQTQSVNTIYFDGNGTIGHNTDIEGFELSIKNIKYNLNDKKILILGAGGVVPSIIFALNKMKVSNIVVANRTKKNAENLKNLFKNLSVIDWGEVPDIDMIINATTLGLNNNDEFNLDFSKVKKKRLFYDVIYNPRTTRFLEIGKKLNCKIENGKMMFIYQALGSFRLWHGVTPKINENVINLLDK